jgi:hydroxyacylglutathione hydrolase
MGLGAGALIVIGGTVAIVDVPEAAPLIAALDARGLDLDMILLTHHHDDHIQGVEELRSKYGCKVIGGKADAHRLPTLDQAVEEGDTVTVGESEGHVLDVSGHTVGHIAFHFPDSDAVFSADSLMALGCGRLFEGTPGQMWESSQKLAALPADTTICSGHEYTAANAKFALTVDPQNPALISRAKDIDSARAKGQPTVPSPLSLELETNPFLRPGDPAIRATLGMPDATDTEVFTEIRRRKDQF